MSRCLGKGPAAKDSRNLMFASVVKAVKVPAKYNVDSGFNPRPPMRMFGNDTLGDCVMACRANATELFEFRETGRYPNITDAEVRNEYFAETGGQDTGLVILDSLKRWRNLGWTAGGRNLKISAYAQVNQRDQNAVKAAVYSDLGIEIGLQLPLSAEAQIEAGKPWTIAKRGSAIGSWGGHCVLVTAYDAAGLTCKTWGQYQSMEWAFFARYCDEAYAVFDAVNSGKARSIKRNVLTAFLGTVDSLPA